MKHENITKLYQYGYFNHCATLMQDYDFLHICKCSPTPTLIFMQFILSFEYSNLPLSRQEEAGPSACREKAGLEEEHRSLETSGKIKDGSYATWEHVVVAVSWHFLRKLGRKIISWKWGWASTGRLRRRRRWEIVIQKPWTMNEGSVCSTDYLVTIIVFQFHLFPWNSASKFQPSLM